MRILLKSKIHKATVTEANVNYIGSITIDEDLMNKAGIVEGEQVHVVDDNNGNRLITYVIKGPKNSGIICMNGGAALLVKKGHEVIIMAYEVTSKKIKHKCILVDKKNKFVRYL
jgi:aspartate 1-decarboxylase